MSIRKSRLVAAGVIPALIDVLQAGECDAVIHASAALGSLALGSSAHLNAVCTDAVAAALASGMDRSEPSAAHACARALCRILSVGTATPTVALPARLPDRVAALMRPADEAGVVVACELLIASARVMDDADCAALIANGAIHFLLGELANGEPRAAAALGVYI
jgi:hypothetical protein